jgi:hypothetical protein
MSLKPPSMFNLVGLPNGVFGETHVIVSVWPQDAAIWAAEYSILIRSPAEHLIQEVVTFDTTGYPAELPPIDEAYMEAEALRQAEIDLILELEKRAQFDGRGDLAFLPIRLERANITPVTLWVRKAYPAKFTDMMNNTKSTGLRTYLKAVASLTRLKSP